MSNDMLWQVQGNQQTLLAHNTCSAWSNTNFVSELTSTNHHSSPGIKKKKKGRFTAWSHTHNFPHCPGWPDPIERRGGGHLSEVTTSLPPWSTSGLSQPHLTNWNRNICWRTNGKSMTGAAQLYGQRAAGRTGVKSCQRAVEQLALPPSLGAAQEAHTQLPSCTYPFARDLLPRTSCSIMCKKSVLFMSGFRKKSTQRKKEIH